MKKINSKSKTNREKNSKKTQLKSVLSVKSINFTIITQAKKLGIILKKKQLKLVTAESCTGGGIAYTLTMIPGASDWFEQGWVTYSNDSKYIQLNVPKKTLKKYGAVSQQTVAYMAKGALENSTAHISIAVTGIAGPKGGSLTKPVGTVWFGLGFRKSSIKIITLNKIFKGSRNKIREKSILFILKNLLEQLS